MPASAERVLYLDSSALVKLVVIEPESTALRALVARASVLVSSALARVEVVRAVAPHGAAAFRSAGAVLGTVDLAGLDDELLEVAAHIDGDVRSFDAIHLATALEVGEELTAVVTYDLRMARAASALGLSTLAPS